MKLSDLKDPVKVVSTPTKPGGFNIDQRSQVSGSFDQSQAALGHSQSLLDTFGGAALGVANEAAGIVPGVMKSGLSTIKSASDIGQNVASAITKPLLGDKANVLPTPEVDAALQPKGIGENVGFGIGEVGQFAGSGGLDLIKGAAKAIPATMDAVRGEGIGGLMSKGISGAKGIVQDYAAKRAAQKATQSTIEAVNPELSGKKLIEAYKKTVTGNRNITPPSLFREQGVTPDQKTINLATRLKDLGLGKDPIKNLDSLGKNLTETETKLESALNGDPNLVYNAQKPALIQKIDAIHSTTPREFSAIKDSKTIFDNVIGFAKETVNKAQDTVKGLRDARTAFDTQAKLEYPNAFKDGVVDTKTPAGRAIQEVRDSINAHLYDTAPNGSEIQQLIGHEADIFRATENIAPKASLGEGRTTIEQLIKENPGLSKLLFGGAILTVGGEGARIATGHGI